VAGIQMAVRSKCHGEGHSDNPGNCMQTYTQRLHNTVKQDFACNM